MITNRRVLRASFVLLFLSASLSTSRRAFADEPAATAEAPAATPSAPSPAAPTPVHAAKSDAAQTPNDRARPEAPLRGLKGHVLLGATILTESNATPLGTLRPGVTYWLDNIGLTASAEGSVNPKSMLLGADLGVRLLGAPGKSGPFVGGGLGVMAYDVRRSGSLGFAGKGTRGTIHAEVGLVTRGFGIASVRAIVPMSALEGTVGESVEGRSGRMVISNGARVTPIAIMGMLGVMF